MSHYCTLRTKWEVYSVYQMEYTSTTSLELYSLHIFEYVK